MRHMQPVLGKVMELDEALLLQLENLAFSIEEEL